MLRRATKRARCNWPRRERAVRCSAARVDVSLVQAHSPSTLSASGSSGRMAHGLAGVDRRLSHAPRATSSAPRRARPGNVRAHGERVPRTVSSSCQWASSREVSTTHTAIATAASGVATLACRRASRHCRKRDQETGATEER